GPRNCRHEEAVAILCNRCPIAIRDPETWHIASPRSFYGFHCFTQSSSKADSDQEILWRHYFHPVMDNAAASNRRIRVVPQPNERVRKRARQGRGIIDANDHDASGKIYTISQIDDLICIQTRSEFTNVLKVFVDALSNAIGDTQLRLLRRFHSGIRCDLSDEMLAEIVGKVSKFLVA